MFEVSDTIAFEERGTIILGPTPGAAYFKSRSASHIYRAFGADSWFILRVAGATLAARPSKRADAVLDTRPDNKVAIYMAGPDSSRQANREARESEQLSLANAASRNQNSWMPLSWALTLLSFWW